MAAPPTTAATAASDSCVFHFGRRGRLSRGLFTVNILRLLGDGSEMLLRPDSPGHDSCAHAGFGFTRVLSTDRDLLEPRGFHRVSVDGPVSSIGSSPSLTDNSGVTTVCGLLSPYSPATRSDVCSQGDRRVATPVTADPVAYVVSGPRVPAQCWRKGRSSLSIGKVRHESARLSVLVVGPEPPRPFLIDAVADSRAARPIPSGPRPDRSAAASSAASPTERRRR
jgi:hypothetical protein